MKQKYEFYDTFIKTCEFTDGQGDCVKTRKSKKCIDGNCEIVKVPMNKKQIMNNYYQNYKVKSDKKKCPYCNKNIHVENLLQHIKKHTEISKSQFGGCDSCSCMIGGGQQNKYKCPLCNEYNYIDEMKTHYNLHKQKGL